MTLQAPTVSYRRPTLYPKQEQAIFSSDRYGIIEGSTKCGKTVACIAWILEQAMKGKQGHTFWWISPVYPQAKIAFRRLKRGLPDNLFRVNESELTVTLANGSTIAFKSAEKPDNLYGEDVYAAVMDEATRMREEAWHAVRSTLTATRGFIRIIGNVKGRRNWAYALARKAEGGERGWQYSKLTSIDAIEAGIVAQDEVDQAQKQLPETVFKELYMAEPSDDGGNPFGQEAIRKCIGDISGKTPTVYGVDLAKSVDWTVCIGMDEDGKVCRFDRYQLPWEETVRRLTKEIGLTPAFIDSTGVGDPIVERIQKDLPNVEGYHFSSTSKQKLMEGLAVAIQTSEIKYPNGAIVSELDAFTFEYTRTGVRYTAPDGTHDDCVMALSLAVYGRTGAAGVGVW